MEAAICRVVAGRRLTNCCGVPKDRQLELDRLLAQPSRRPPSGRGTLARPIGDPYSNHMSGLRARVEKGRLILHEPTTLPEGTVVDLVADDEGDDLTADERQALQTRCPRPGHQPRRVVFVQHRRFWTNCVSAGELAGPNHSRSGGANPRSRELVAQESSRLS